MIKAIKTKEIVINAVNDEGVLTEITQLLASKGIGMQAVSCRVEGIKTVVHLVADDHTAAVTALRAKKFEPFDVEAVLIDIPNIPGALKKVVARLEAQKIRIGYLYATSSQMHDRTLVVASTSHIDKTIGVLKKEK